jgi:hypothetical protein
MYCMYFGTDRYPCGCGYEDDDIDTRYPNIRIHIGHLKINTKLSKFLKRCNISPVYKNIHAYILPNSSL